jgi:predicted regulator of Ras-like GTPase activity (Roadblock/LC7/MglB family)
MDAEQALADLTEISSQIQAAVIFDDKGRVVASTIDDTGRAEQVARGAARLFEEAEEIRTGDLPPTQLEAATSEGSVFIVDDGKTRIAATTAPQPTVGLVFYDLKSALRQIEPAVKRPGPKGPPGTKRSPKPAAKTPPAAKKPAPPKKSAPPKKKPTPRKKPDAS